MKAIFTIIAVLISTSVATFTFANNSNPIKGTATTIVALPIDNSDDVTEISAAMDAVLGNLIVNNTLAVTATTMDNGTMMTVTSNEEVMVSNEFVLHVFGETSTSEDLTPAAPAMEIIALDAEEM
jgi:hypothetical protein